MYSSVKLNFSKLKNVQLLVNEQYIDSTMHGAKKNVAFDSLTSRVKAQQRYQRCERTECQVVPLRAMEAYCGGTSTAPLIRWR